jgi:hypothetical protein
MPLDESKLVLNLGYHLRFSQPKSMLYDVLSRSVSRRNGDFTNGKSRRG